jgi:hypothetical protein
MRSKNCEMVPAEPFSDWLNQRVAYWATRLDGAGGHEGETGPAAHVCQEVGWWGSLKRERDTGIRKLYRFRTRHSEKTVGRVKGGGRGVIVKVEATEFPRDVVEEALHHAGVLFEELYPGIAAAEEVMLEPEKWCPHCQEARHPINGVCAFCDWRLAPATGQTLRGRMLTKRRKVVAA